MNVTSRNQTPNVKHLLEQSAIDVIPLSAAGASPAADSTNGVVCRGIICVGAGNIDITTTCGKRRLIAVPAGQFQIGIEKLHFTGTTATGVSLLV